MSMIDRVLEGLSVRVEPFALCEVRGTGRLWIGARERVTIHYALAGAGRLDLGGGRSRPMRSGCVVIVPAGLRHGLQSDAPTGDARSLPSCHALTPAWESHKAGTGDTGLLVACAEFSALYHQAEDLFAHRTEPLLLQPRPRDPVCRIMEQMIDELADPGPGASALVEALMRQCLVHVLRRLDTGGDDGADGLPWLNALDDERLGRALDAINRTPEAAHSLASLAALAGMSRSTFAAHFTRTFGQGPIAMLHDVRLEKAALLLRTENRPVKELAARVGYDSRSYFSRAFRQRFGLSPAAYRDAAAAGAAHTDRP